MPCNHDWVIYTPFHMGDPYQYCSLCDIKKDDWVAGLYKWHDISGRYDKTDKQGSQAFLYGNVEQTSKQCPVVEKYKDKIVSDIVSEASKKHLTKLMKGK